MYAEIYTHGKIQVKNPTLRFVFLATTLAAMIPAMVPAAERRGCNGGRCHFDGLLVTVFADAGMVAGMVGLVGAIVAAAAGTVTGTAAVLVFRTTVSKKVLVSS